jgi:hypothetical protein
MLQNKLMKVKDYEDGDSCWRIACDCGSPEHDVNLWFSADQTDKQCGSLNLTLSMEIGAYSHISYNFNKWYWRITKLFETIKWRIAVAFKILFIGHYTMQGDVILDLDGINAMKLALQEGLLHAKNNPPPTKSTI